MPGIRRQVRQVDAETGEVLDGLMVHIFPKKKLKDEFSMMFSHGLLMLAADSDLKWQDLRVLLVYLGSMDYENIIRISQQDVADILEINKQNVYRATKKLVGKNILIEEGKEGRSKIYRLNSFYGWKGNVDKNYKDLFEQDSKLIA